VFIERNTHLNINGTVYTLLHKRPIKCNLEMSGDLDTGSAHRGAAVRRGANTLL